MAEWMSTQECWNPEVVIIFGAAAHYGRATSSHDGARPDNSALHTGAVRSHTGFVGSLYFISPRTGHVRMCSKCCQLFSEFRVRALLVHASIFSAGLSKQEEALMWLPR
jgi:hypothetical protein